MVFGQKLKIFTSTINNTRHKSISKGADWRKFQFHSIFQPEVKGPQRITSISVKTPDYDLELSYLSLKLMKLRKVDDISMIIQDQDTQYVRTLCRNFKAVSCSYNTVLLDFDFWLTLFGHPFAMLYIQVQYLLQAHYFLVLCTHCDCIYHQLLYNSYSLALPSVKGGAMV